MLNGSAARSTIGLAYAGRAAPRSKVSVSPPESWVIPRHRLAERLTHGSRGPLTVVTGPPGAGKTIAVASWAVSGRAPGPVAWLSCDESDDDPALFWCDVTEAIEYTGVAVSSTAKDDFGRVVLSELASDLATQAIPVVLVLDDLKLKPDSRVIDGLSYLVKNARPGLRLVIIARVDPPLALHRYRLSNELTEIRGPDLALSERETAALVAQHGVALRPGAVRMLRERTEGWAAGVRLAAMSLEGLADPDSFVAQFAGDDRAVAAYLIEEALDCQPSDVRRLMLAISVAERFNAELALELTAGGDEQTFSAMVRSNAFVIPLGQGWYRYHHMVGEALRLILRHESPATATGLYRRASAWFNRKGLLADAVRHAVLASDWRYASRLVVDQLGIGQVLGLVAGSQLVGLFADMPARVIANEHRPEPALVAAADAAARGDRVSCAVTLDRADLILGRLPEDQASAARLTADAIRLFLQASQELAVAPDANATAEQLLARLSRVSFGRHPELHALGRAIQGRTALWAGHIAEAAAAFEDAVSRASEAGSDGLRRYCLGHLALLEALLGRLSRAADLVTKAGRRSEAQNVQGGLPASALRVARAWLCLEHCEIEDAGRELATAKELLQAYPDVCLSALCGLIGARVELVNGSPVSAIEATKAAVQLPPWLNRMMALVEADAHAEAGDARAAIEAAERAGGLAAPDSVVALVRAQVCRGDVPAAIRMLQPLLELAAMPTDLRVDAMLLDAHLSYTVGDQSRSRRSIARALRLAQRERRCLPFALSKAWLGPLLEQDPELVRQHYQLLAPLQVAQASPISAVNGHGHDEPPAFGRLSARELDVLRRVARMMTSEEIAEEMSLSINTVKTHLRNVYRKLAVTRRFEAVRRAQRLQLL